MVSTLLLLGLLASASASVAGPRLAPLGQPHQVWLGTNDNWSSLSSADLRFAEAAGAPVLRFPAGMQEVLPDGPGSWHWELLDRIFAGYRERGMKVIFEPAGAPCWAQRRPRTCTGPGVPGPRHLRQWARYLRAFVSRYSDLIVAVEIWNEPNLKPFWPARINPAYYSRILRVSYPAVKAVRPGLPVLFGGLAPLLRADRPGALDYRRFLRRAYRAGARNHFDALAFHPYTTPFTRPDYLRQMRWMITRLSELAARRRDAGIPIWITEVGIPSADLTGEEQARRIAATLETLSRTRRVRAIIVHRMFDDPSIPLEADFGLVRAARIAKPAFCALARFGTGTCSPPPPIPILGLEADYTRPGSGRGAAW